MRCLYCGLGAVAVCSHCGAAVCERHGVSCEDCGKSLCNPDTTGTQCWDVHSCHYPLELEGIEEEVYRAILRVQMRHKDLAPVSAVLIECTKRGIKSKDLENAIKSLKEKGLISEVKRGFLGVK